MCKHQYAYIKELQIENTRLRTELSIAIDEKEKYKKLPCVNKKEYVRRF